LGAGILLGFTFLAHTGVGLVLAGIMFLTSCLRRPSSQRSRRSIATVLGVPCSVALPFIALLLLPIALRYRFHVFNRDPAVWAYDGAYPSVIAAGALRPSAVITLLIVVIGGLWIRRNLRPTVSIVLMSWAIVATAGLLYSVWVEQAPQWPALVSAYHFLFAVRALKWLVFGCGVIAITTATWEHFGFRSRMPVDVFCATAVLLLAVAIYPRYLGREAFRVGYEKSAHTVTADDERVYDWIRTNTDRDDVFLSSDNDALRVVGPAGRFVVSVERFFSNPYVRHEVRSADRDEMYASLLRGDRSTFEQRRERYDVQYVLARDSDIATIRQRSAEFLDLVFTSGSIAIFEVKPAAGS
jgi:hypothetical protein